MATKIFTSALLPLCPQRLLQEFVSVHFANPHIAELHRRNVRGPLRNWFATWCESLPERVGPLGIPLSCRTAPVELPLEGSRHWKAGTVRTRSLGLGKFQLLDLPLRKGCVQSLDNFNGRALDRVNRVPNELAADVDTGTFEELLNLFPIVLFRCKRLACAEGVHRYLALQKNAQAAM